MTDLAGIKKRFLALSRLLDERSRRLVAGAESLALPRGGISAVSRATGISRPVIRQGIAELKNPKTALHSVSMNACFWPMLKETTSLDY